MTRMVGKKSLSVLRRLAVALVLLLTLAVRIDRAVREPILNPDAIRIIEQGRLLTQDPLRAVRTEVYHPLHSGLAAMVHGFPISQMVRDDRAAWVVAIKTVGILSAVAVAGLILRLSRHFGAPWWAACGAAVLWAVGRRTSTYGADGLTDMLYLALFGWAILVGLRTRLHYRPGMWLVAGGLSGLSYLARPEGVAAALILGLTVLLYYARFHVRFDLQRVLGGGGKEEVVRRTEAGRSVFLWGDAVRSVACLFIGFLVIAAPYMVAIGAFTHKKDVPLLQALVGGPRVAVAGLGAMSWNGMGEMGLKMATELWETFGFAPALVVLLAMLLKPRLWGRAHWGPLVLVWIFTWLAVMLWLLNKTAAGGRAYLDGRHTLALQLPLHCLFALALPLWMRPMVWWQGFWRRREVWSRLPGWMRWGRWPGVMSAGALFLGVLPGVILLADPPAKDKGYLRDAANYLRIHAARNAMVADRDRRLGYVSGLQYWLWMGSPANPMLEALPREDREHPLILTYIFQRDEGQEPTRGIGPYEAVKTFTSVGARHGDVLVIYARPEAHAFQ